MALGGLNPDAMSRSGLCDGQVKFVLIAFFKKLAVFKIFNTVYLEIALSFHVRDNLEFGLYLLRRFPVV